MKKLNVKAILLGLGAYILVWVIWNIFLHLLVDEDENISGTYMFIFQIFNFLSALIPGLVAAMVAKTEPIKHGVVTGLVLAIVLVLYLSSFSIVEETTLTRVWFLPLFLLFMSSLGGVLAGWKLRGD